MSAVNQLRALMREHGLTNADTAALAEVSEKTVESWFASEGSASRRIMPGRHLRMVSSALPGFIAAKKRR